MPRIQVGTERNAPVTLHVQDCGNGKPVVLIHGWPLSHRMWEPQIEPLTQQGLRVIAYDRRGFGESDKPWGGYDYDTFASDLHAVLEALDVDGVTLVGFSMGGGEVARYLGRYGAHRVSRAIFVAAVTPFLQRHESNPEGVPEDVFDDMVGQVREDRIAFLDAFGKKFVNAGLLKHPVSEHQLAYNRQIASFASPHATLECIRAFSRTDFREDLARITVPTLFIHGDADAIVPLEASAQRATALVPNSQLEVIPGAPHGLNATHPDELNVAITDFIAG
jgi:non-heme chloroperoxidase